MRKVILTVLISSFLLACSNTKLTVSWTQEYMQAKQYENVGVAVISPDDPNRLLIEESISNEFKKSGVNSTITFYNFPLAGKKEILSELTYEPEEFRRMIVDKVKANKIDALLLVSLLDANKETRYVSNVVTVGTYYDPTFPVYTQSYYDYYSYVYNTTYSSGYYTTETTYFLETNLYDIETEKLVWTAQTKTEDMTSVAAEANELAKIVVKDIIEKKVILID